MFVQIINFHTQRLDEGLKLVDEWRERTAGKRTAHRAILARDRDEEGSFFNIVFFDSYESAMQNSQMPETSDLSAKLAALSEGEPAFYNLEVLRDEE